jgi:site-specific DNA-methyltransferase (adenine-specific)
VLDPFTGSGTTAVVALENKRNFVGTELNPEYIQLAENRIKEEIPSTLASLMQ